MNSKNYSETEVTSEIYPYSTYSYLVAALFVFLFTDLLHYKPVILTGTFCYLTNPILLIWGSTLISVQCAQVACGGAEVVDPCGHPYDEDITSMQTQLYKPLDLVVSQIVISTTASPNA